MCWAVEVRLANLPYPDTQPAPLPLPSLVSTPKGRGELTLGKAMSFSPRMGGPVLEDGCLGAPLHDSVPWGR